ncbi:prolipoprotein diacylglyceryl transferase [Luteolibacter ambystomatis]|uniref:Phosphatidylglycerol--prolipoprotein diacylglyceryl transferase n=1 Tax=Luteolibacter ambystomatis TaxID=2824561 RepID=A0A975IZI7_9BACT|nr:prolipoprotein diacylglyceryl transferase [Luteolibacter ambystomatis]QUE51511.1 prolipoprotein diacylglyceryl transferase [Luteolibacter ambystomatis]
METGSPLAGRAGIVCAAGVFATYVHHFDPVALQIGSFALRWYGLAYLGGFAAGFLLLKHLAKRGLWVLKPEEAGDFIAAAALLGVFIGGRLGYVLFYQILESSERRAEVFHDPLSILRVWEGGMASHGGIIGLIIFTWFYAKKKKVAWTALGDGLCVVAPVGLFFGRLANFVNGELYGRHVAEGAVPWAMKFPLALNDRHAPEYTVFDGAFEAVAAKVPAVAQAGMEGTRESVFQAILEANRQLPEVRTILEPFLQPRHPSQLYEAGLEGVALFSILWFVRVKFPKAPNGLLTGLFFAFYALFRIIGENFREPDAAMFGPITKGQFLSLFMFAFAAAFFVHAWRQWRKTKLAVETA